MIYMGYYDKNSSLKKKGECNYGSKERNDQRRKI